MKTYYLTLLLLTLLRILIFVGPAEPAYAVTLTPSLTPTLEYSNLQTTPTPIVLGTAPVWLDTRPAARNMADTAINMYHAINFGGVLDLVIFAMFAGLMIRGIFRMIKRAKKIE